MEVSGALRLRWEDPRLAWDPAAVGGCEEIRVAASDIWTPSITSAGAEDAYMTELAVEET